jgi:thioredoxin-like negative regulator of GroEL
LKVREMNVDTNPKLAARYEIESIPALVDSKDGRDAAGHAGATSEAVRRRELKRPSAAAGPGPPV